MTERKWTPGPWMVLSPVFNPHTAEVGDTEGRRICVGGGPRRRENAAFIATAPDMAALIAAQAAEIERLRGLLQDQSRFASGFGGRSAGKSARRAELEGTKP